MPQKLGQNIKDILCFSLCTVQAKYVQTCPLPNVAAVGSAVSDSQIKHETLLLMYASWDNVTMALSVQNLNAVVLYSDRATVVLQAAPSASRSAPPPPCTATQRCPVQVSIRSCLSAP